MVMANSGAITSCVVYAAYIDEGCLWMDLDSEGDHVKLIPLTFLAAIDLEATKEGFNYDKA